MSLFQLYEANKAKYKQLKPGSIWRCKGVPGVKLRIISTNLEDKVSLVRGGLHYLPIYLSNLYLLDIYEPCEDSLE
jgi:hypothetical protein